MSTESIVAIVSTVINGVLMLGIWKLFNEYKAYNKETSWKNVKEHYEEIKIPHEVAKAVEEINNQISKEAEEMMPELENLQTQMTEMGVFIARVLKGMDRKEAQRIIDQQLPSCKYYFKRFFEVQE